MNKTLIPSALAAMLLAACSTQTVYESMQGAARQECHRLPDAREQLECLRQRDMSYEQYRKQRGPLSGEAARTAPN